MCGAAPSSCWNAACLRVPRTYRRGKCTSNGLKAAQIGRQYLHRRSPARIMSRSLQASPKHAKRSLPGFPKASRRDGPVPMSPSVTQILVMPRSQQRRAFGFRAIPSDLRFFQPEHQGARRTVEYPSSGRYLDTSQAQWTQ